MSREEQVVERFYHKVAHLIVNSRVYPALQTTIASKPWFLLATPESAEVQARVQQLQTEKKHPRVMYIDILLNLSDVAASLRSRDAALFLASSTTSEKLQLDNSFLSKKQMILLERWQLTLDVPVNNHVQIGPMYSACSIYFRALYTFLRTLPAMRLSQQLGRRGRSRFGNLLPLDQASMKIDYNISSTRTLSSSVQQLDSSILGWPNDSTTQATFPGKIETPFGTFYLSVSYRTTCTFELTSLRDSPNLSDYVAVGSPAVDVLGSYTFPDASPRLTATATPPRPAPARTHVWSEHPSVDADVLSDLSDSFTVDRRRDRSGSGLIIAPDSPPVHAASTPPRPVPPRTNVFAGGHTPPGSTPPGSAPSSMPGRVHSGSALLLQNQWKTLGSNTNPDLLEFMEMMRETPRSTMVTPAPVTLSMTSDKSVNFRSLHSEMQSLQLQLSKSTTTEGELPPRVLSAENEVLRQPPPSTILESTPAPLLIEKDAMLEPNPTSGRPVMASPGVSADAPSYSLPLNFQSRTILPIDSEASSDYSIASLDVDNSQEDPSLLFNAL